MDFGTSELFSEGFERSTDDPTGNGDSKVYAEYERCWKGST